MKYFAFLNFIALLSCHSDKQVKMKAQQKSAIENYVQAYNSFKIEGMLKDLDPSVIFENISNGKVDLATDGVVAFKEQAEAAKSYFTKRKQTITNWVFADRVVTVDIQYEAVLAMDFPNGLKKGDSLQLSGRSVFYFKDGKINKIQDKS